MDDLHKYIKHNEWLEADLKRATKALAETERELKQARSTISTLRMELEALEIQLAIEKKLPVFIIEKDGQQLHFLAWKDQAFVVARDVIAQFHAGTFNYSSDTEAMKSWGLGFREYSVIDVPKYVEPWGVRPRVLTRTLGRKGSLQKVTVLNRNGVDALKEKNPKLAAWLQEHGFPIAEKALLPGGAQ